MASPRIVAVAVLASTVPTQFETLPVAMSGGDIVPGERWANLLVGKTVSSGLDSWASAATAPKNRSRRWNISPGGKNCALVLDDRRMRYMLLRGIGSMAVLVAATVVSACSASVTPAHVGPAQDGMQSSRFRIAGGTPDLTNLLTDGSFEKPLVPVGGFTVFNVGSTFSRWTVTGPGGDVGIVSGTFTQNGFSFPAGCGNQFIDLTGIETLGDGVQQTITTVMGSQHVLSFSVGNVVDPNGIFGTTSTVKIYVNDVHVFSGKNGKGAGGSVQIWKPFTTTITAPSTRTTIRFTNGDPPGDDNNGLDCIKLN